MSDITWIFGTGSICLDDIEKYATVSPKNGKRYINFVVRNKKEPWYEYTHELNLSKSKEEREANTPEINIANIREYKSKKVEERREYHKDNTSHQDANSNPSDNDSPLF